MANLRFIVDWTEPNGIRGPELSATCARLRIEVNGALITRIAEVGRGEIRDAVNVPLYPLAEWLATNWWFLTSEILNPDKERDAGFLRRHALRTNREGYAYPNLEIVSSGSSTNLVWKRGMPPWWHAPLDEGEFLGGRSCASRERRVP